MNVFNEGITCFPFEEVKAQKFVVDQLLKMLVES